MSLIEPNQQLTARTKAERATDRPVKGRVKAALDLMVYQGTPWNEAAIQVGLTTQSMRLALCRPHCLKYLRETKYVFREAISAANPMRLARIADQTDNHAAAVNAIRTLERMNDDDTGSSSARPAPGFALVIVQQGTTPSTTLIEAVANKPDNNSD
jgi:hypothetical protein